MPRLKSNLELNLELELQIFIFIFLASAIIYLSLNEVRMFKLPCIVCHKPTDHKAAICTVACWHKLAHVPLLQGQPPETRLFGRTIREHNGCWIWQGAVLKTGHGSFCLEGKGMTAHRAAYILRKGPVPEGHQVRRTCKSLLCVNPEHLILLKTKAAFDLEAPEGVATATN